MNTLAKIITLVALTAAIPAQADTDNTELGVQTERAAAQQQKFNKHDADNNGVLSPEEFQPGKERHKAAKKFSRLDVNQDGQLSSDELTRR
ncbi:MAG: hypothetical protein PHR16_05690 [Methylovulum sp.]|nr:hypothetical protein [Methylovulum sp.]